MSLVLLSRELPHLRLRSPQDTLTPRGASVTSPDGGSVHPWARLARALVGGRDPEAGSPGGGRRQPGLPPDECDASGLVAALRAPSSGEELPRSVSAVVSKLCPRPSGCGVSSEASVSLLATKHCCLVNLLGWSKPQLVCAW